jgi:hypothetical protein
MRSTKKFSVLGALITIAFMSLPLGVHAGTESEPAGYWGFVNGEWTTQSGEPEAVININYDESCVDVSVTGEEFDFSVTVEESITTAALYDLENLFDCLDNTLGDVTLTAAPEGNWYQIASLGWIDLEGNIPNAYPCLQVEVSDGQNPQIDSFAELNPLEFNTSISPLHTGGDLENSPGFSLMFFVDDSVENLDDTNLSWTFDITARPCSSGWDGPDIDIEHYRQRAAEMTALPDTL